MPGAEKVVASVPVSTAGFTLVEVLVVLTILALVTVLGVPRLGAMLPTQRLNDATDALANEVALLRAEAMRTGRGTRLQFDPATNAFFSSRRGARALTMSGVRVAVENDPLSRADPDEIRFLPGGSSTGGRIRLADAAGSRLLAISRITGSLRRGDGVP